MKKLKLFKPAAALYKETHLDKPNQYFLHAITFCDNSNYVMDGFKVEEKPDKKLIKVELLAKQSDELPSVNTLMPVVHTISLGEIPFEENGTIRVIFTAMDSSGQAAKNNPKSGIKLVTPGAVEIGKPVPGDDSFEALWEAAFGKAEEEQE